MCLFASVFWTSPPYVCDCDCISGYSLTGPSKNQRQFGMFLQLGAAKAQRHSTVWFSSIDVRFVFVWRSIRIALGRTRWKYDQVHWSYFHRIFKSSSPRFARVYLCVTAGVRPKLMRLAGLLCLIWAQTWKIVCCTLAGVVPQLTGIVCGNYVQSLFVFTEFSNGVFPYTSRAECIILNVFLIAEWWWSR